MIGFLKRRRHNRLRTLLSSYIDGEVSSAESQEVEGHLATCEECQAELDSLRITVNLISGLPELALPRSFVLTEAPASAPSASPLVWTTRLATSAAALLLFALVLGDALGLVSQSTMPVPQTAEFSVPAPERASSAPAQPDTFAQSSRIAPTAPPIAVPAPAAPAPALPAPAAPVPAPAAPAPATPGTPEAAAAIQPAQAAPAPLAAQAQLAAEPAPTSAPGEAQEPAIADVQSLAAAPTLAQAGAESAIVESDVTPSPSVTEAPLEARSSEFEILASPEAGQPGDTRSFSARQGASIAPSETAVMELPKASGTDEDRAPERIGETTAPNEAANEPEAAGVAVPNPTPGAILEAAPEVRGVALPLRELQIAAAVILVLLGITSLLVARRNRLWPFGP